MVTLTIFCGKTGFRRFRGSPARVLTTITRRIRGNGSTQKLRIGDRGSRIENRLSILHLRSSILGCHYPALEVTSMGRYDPREGDSCAWPGRHFTIKSGSLTA